MYVRTRTDNVRTRTDKYHNQQLSIDKIAFKPLRPHNLAKYLLPSLDALHHTWLISPLSASPLPQSLSSMTPEEIMKEAAEAFPTLGSRQPEDEDIVSLCVTLVPLLLRIPFDSAANAGS